MVQKQKHTKSNTELDLESLVFGKDHFNSIENNPQKPYKTSKTTLNTNTSDSDDTIEEENLIPAWNDSDDEKMQIDASKLDEENFSIQKQSKNIISGKEYVNRLRKIHHSLNPIPNWAIIKKRKLSIKPSILQTTTKLTTFIKDVLPENRISFSLMKNQKLAVNCRKEITSIEFNSNGNLFLVSSFDKVLRLFKFDGLENCKLQSIHFQGMPIFNSRFCGPTNQIILTGKRKSFVCLNALTGKIQKIPFVKGQNNTLLEKFETSPCGNYIAFLGESGYIILVSSKTKQWISNLKINGSVISIAFSYDGKELYTIGNEGEIYIWNVQNQRCVFKHKDNSCVKGNAIAISPCGHFLAVGDDCGVVNLYQIENSEKEIKKIRLIKSFDNLTTTITSLDFNHTSEILSVASKYKRNAVKLIHVRSRSVFSNWPNNKLDLGYVCVQNFSFKSGIFALGNTKGKVFIFRFPYFSQI